jgi:hypothetical protein
LAPASVLLAQLFVDGVGLLVPGAKPPFLFPLNLLAPEMELKLEPLLLLCMNSVSVDNAVGTRSSRRGSFWFVFAVGLL